MALTDEQIATLVVETGAGLSDADSFVSIADADAYWEPRADAGWNAATSAQKAKALRAATDYLGFAYLWPGRVKLTTQSLQWPRINAVDTTAYAIDSNSVPNAVKRATIVLAREALTTDLLAQTTSDEALTEKSVQVGGIRTTNKYAQPRPVTLKSYAQVDAILRLLTTTRRAAGGIHVVKLRRQ